MRRIHDFRHYVGNLGHKKDYEAKTGLISGLKAWGKKAFGIEGVSKGYEKQLYADTWKCFGSARKVLELGCATGSFLENAPPGVEAHGLERDFDAVVFCRKKGLRVKHGDALRMPFADNSFAGVYSSHVLEHLQGPVRAIREMRRVLRPGGVVVIRTPDFRRAYAFFYDDYTHVTPLTRMGLYRLLADEGFESISIGPGYYTNELFFLLSFWPALRVFLEKALGYFLSTEMVAVASKASLKKNGTVIA